MVELAVPHRDRDDMTVVRGGLLLHVRDTLNDASVNQRITTRKEVIRLGH